VWLRGDVPLYLYIHNLCMWMRARFFTALGETRCVYIFMFAIHVCICLWIILN
jgi:hypothetical protein